MSGAARILVATDVVGDANLVRKLLHDEFANVAGSTDPDVRLRISRNTGPKCSSWPSTAWKRLRSVRRKSFPNRVGSG